MAVPKFSIKYTDGRTVEVRVAPKAQVLFERQYSTTMSRLADDVSAEQGYYLAWAGLHCAGAESHDFETWLGLIDEIEYVEQPGDVEEPDPTRRTATPASLSG